MNTTKGQVLHFKKPVSKTQRLAKTDMFVTQINIEIRKSLKPTYHCCDGYCGLIISNDLMFTPLMPISEHSWTLVAQHIIMHSSLFKDAVPHGDREQAVDVVGEGTGLKKQEERYQQAHTHKHLTQMSPSRLKIKKQKKKTQNRKHSRQVIQNNIF